jgi:HK97 gp10 family phage protein
MARKHRRLAVRIRFDGLREIAGDLEKIGLTLRSPEVTAEVQRGADIVAARAKVKAPQDKGNLRTGIYTVSALRDGFRPLTRYGNRLNSGLRYPARPGQVLLVSSVYYSLFVERGRSKKGKGGYMRARPYFKVAVNESKETAQAFILARIRKLIESKWNGKR